MSLNIIIDADVQSATQKIGKFVYTMKKDFQEVEKTVRRTSTTVKESTDKMAEATNSFGKSSRNSLTALSLTLQDLPFGFIGIQNNLPGVIQGFGQMSMEAKTGASVMTQLKTALLGPAGLFLAFSAVTAGVTALTLKYGGLGNAIDAIFGKTNLLINAQKEYNKELAKEIASSATQSAEITILTKVLTDLTKPLKDRQAAYVELTKINPAVVAGIKLENISTAESVKIINENAKAIQKLLVLKAQEAAISNILTTNAEKLATLQIEEKKLQKDLTDGESAYNKIKKEGQVILGAGRNAGEQAIITINNTKKSINDNRKEQAKLNKVTESYINLLDPTIKGIAEIDLQTRNLTESTKKQKKEREKSITLKGVLGPGSLLDTEAAFAAYVKGNINIQKASIDKILRDRTTYKRKEIEEGIGIPKKIGKIGGTPLSAALEAQLGAFQNYVAKLQEVEAILTNTFFQPLENAFMNLFETGKFGFKAFADAVLKQIQQMVAKIIATGIIKLIANILVPGSGGVANGAAAGFGKIIADIFSGIGGNRTANPSFGGVGPGSMGMSGQVNVVLRGSDLVGALNRTNATINRVG
jgi:hypothetical protein